MFVWSRDYKELQAELRVLERQLRESEKQTSYAEAKLDSQEEYVKKLEVEVEFLKKEKKELLDDLLIAAGVKMSDYQKALAQKELERSGDDEISFSGQTRNWAHKKTQESFITQEERNKRAIDIIEELEREALVNTGGIGNV